MDGPEEIRISDDDAGPSSRDFLNVFPKVALPMFLALSDQSIVATALPAIAGSLGAVEQVSLVVIGYLIAATVAAPVYGRLGDAFGRRRMLLGALAIFTAASALCLFSVNLAMLVVGRVLQGLGGGGLMALSQALIGETVAPRARARYQGYLASVGVTSNALGPVLGGEQGDYADSALTMRVGTPRLGLVLGATNLSDSIGNRFALGTPFVTGRSQITQSNLSRSSLLGGLLTEHFGWRSTFLFPLPLCVLAFWLIRRLPKRASRAGDFAFDYVGLLLFACFVVSMLVLFQQVQRFDPRGLPLVLGLLAVAVVSFLLLVRVERRLPSPLLPVDLFRDPTIWRANGMAACHGAILVSLLTFVPIYLRVVHELSAGQTGLLLVPMTVGIGIGSIITGQIVSRTGRTAVLPSWGLALVAIGLCMIAFFAPRFRPADLSASLGLMALFLGTVMSVVQVTVQMAAGREKIGAAAASVQYARSMGAALGTAAVAAVLFASLSWTAPEAGRLFGEVLQHGAAVLAELSAERSAMIQAEFAQSFRAAFLAIAGFAALGGLFVWTLPVRRI